MYHQLQPHRVCSWRTSKKWALLHQLCYLPVSTTKPIYSPFFTPSRKLRYSEMSGWSQHCRKSRSSHIHKLHHLSHHRLCHHSHLFHWKLLIPLLPTAQEHEQRSTVPSNSTMPTVPKITLFRYMAHGQTSSISAATSILSSICNWVWLKGCRTFKDFWITHQTCRSASELVSQPKLRKTMFVFCCIPLRTISGMY